MKKTILNATLILIFFAIATLISLQFIAVIEFLVLQLSFGWVFGTIFIRLFVMIFFILGVLHFLLLLPKEKRLKDYWAILIGIGPGFLLSFALFPIYNTDYGMLNDDLQISNFEQLEADSYDSYQHVDEKKVLAFLDIGCGHCREACYKFTLIKEQNPDLPFYLFFYNDTVYVEDFVATYGDNQFSPYYLKSNESFINFAGFEFPSIYYVDESSTSIYHWVGDELNYTAMDYLTGLKQ